MTRAPMSILIERPVTTYITPTGEVQVLARHLIFNGKPYTAKTFGDYIRNEVFRKNSPSHTRTTSRRWRAGTRRTKRYTQAYATR
jgi:hypothetical protein